MAFARVSFHDPEGPPHKSAGVEVLVDQNDSDAELRGCAIIATRGFFEKRFRRSRSKRTSKQHTTALIRSRDSPSVPRSAQSPLCCALQSRRASPGR